MVKNNKLLENLHLCAKSNGECRGCFYGDGSEIPNCMLHMMRDLLFFFNNPVPNPNAHVLSLEELDEACADHKDHICFAEFINSIHVATPVIRTVTRKGVFINLFDPQTNANDQFLDEEYYIKVRVWSDKPTDSLRNATPWTPIDSFQEDDTSPINRTKTSDIMRYVSKMKQS